MTIDGNHVLSGGVSHIRPPTEAGVPLRQPQHQAIAHGLRDNSGRGHTVAERVAINQGIVRHTDFGERQPINHHRVFGQIAGTRPKRSQTPVVGPQKSRQGAPHRQCGGNPDIHVIDFTGGGGPDAEGERSTTDEDCKSVPFFHWERLAVAHPSNPASPGRKHDGRGHHRTSEGTTACFIDANEEPLLGPGRPLSREGRAWGNAVSHGSVTCRAFL